MSPRNAGVFMWNVDNVEKVLDIELRFKSTLLQKRVGIKRQIMQKAKGL